MSISQQIRRVNWVNLLGIAGCAGLIALWPATRLLGAERPQATDTGAPAGPAAPDATAAAPGTAELEEVTVTAERFAENLQVVPIAIYAATAAQLQASGVTNLQSLNALVPNITNTGVTTNFTYIRGIGSSNASLNNEAAVATYVDGVYMASPYGQFGNFNNIDRIEVLKGPQGTLFGRDTTGGVIQIITTAPSQDAHSDWSVGYGNYSTVSGQGYMTGGLTENLSADLALTYEDQMNGFGTDLCPNQNGSVCDPSIPEGTHQNFGARTKGLWTLSDMTKVVVEGDYELYRSTGGLQMVSGSIDAFDVNLPKGSPIPVVTFPGRYNTYGVPYVLRAQQYGESLHIDHDFSDGLHFVSITSYRQLDGYELHDNTRTPDNALYTIAEQSRGTYETQELQLIDQKPGRINWLLGAYYFGDQVGYDPRYQTGSLVDAASYLAIFADQTIRSYSGYGQVTADLGWQTKLELSARYTDESVELNGQYENAAGQTVGTTGTATGATVYRSFLKYNPWTYRAVLDHQFDKDVMGYISFTHGFKSGGFNLPTPQRNAYLPETINSYEAGVKSEFLDHRIRLNVALWYYNYHNIQVVIVPGLSGQLFTNAGAANALGVDSDLNIAVTQHLSVFAGFGYLHGYYTDFPAAEFFTSAGVGVAIPNAAGYQLPYAPRYSGSLGFKYTLPTSVGDFSIAPTVSFTDKYPFTTDTNFEISRIIMVNAQAEWDSSDIKGFGVRVWGRNLANEYYYAAPVESSGGWYGTPGMPRTFGVTLMMKF